MLPLSCVTSAERGVDGRTKPQYRAAVVFSQSSNDSRLAEELDASAAAIDIYRHILLSVFVDIALIQIGVLCLY